MQSRGVRNIRSGYWRSTVDQPQALQLGPELARDGRSEVLYVLPEFGEGACARNHGDDRGMRQRKLQGSGGKGYPVTVTGPREVDVGAERQRVTGIRGLTEAQRATLRALGATEEVIVPLSETL